VARALHRLNRKPTTMNNNNPTSIVPASTYSMLEQSEEKRSGLLETAVFLLIILSVAVSIWEFASQPVAIPGASEKTPDLVAQYNRDGLRPL
jgi:hypothetical protein